MEKQQYIIILKKSFVSFFYIHYFMLIFIPLFFYGLRVLGDFDVSSEHKGKLAIGVVLGILVLGKFIFDIVIFLAKPWRITLDLNEGGATAGYRTFDLTALKNIEIAYCRFGVMEVTFNPGIVIPTAWSSGSFYRINNWRKNLRVLGRAKKKYAIELKRINRFQNVGEDKLL